MIFYLSNLLFSFMVKTCLWIWSFAINLIICSATFFIRMVNLILLLFFDDVCKIFWWDTPTNDRVIYCWGLSNYVILSHHILSYIQLPKSNSLSDYLPFFHQWTWQLKAHFLMLCHFSHFISLILRVLCLQTFCIS